MIAYPWASPSASAMRISSSASGRGRNDPGVRGLSIVDVSSDDIIGREAVRVKRPWVHPPRPGRSRCGGMVVVGGSHGLIVAPDSATGGNESPQLLEPVEEHHATAPILARIGCAIRT